MRKCFDITFAVKDHDFVGFLVVNDREIVDVAFLTAQVLGQCLCICSAKVARTHRHEFGQQF